ncbi:MAG TPA: hypothetical protein PLG59_05010 [bacterium]|nr:hypothetical protein [bacterium]HQO33996.1 hypothetical protein [bacterium]HQP98109.1 hypothetical protein [bacterium]
MNASSRSAYYLLFCVFYVAATVPAYASDDVLPNSWYVDRSLFPKAYGILDSEPLMFPVDMGDWPVKIDSTHQLFLDDYLIASVENIEREIHHPHKHPNNPLIVPDEPWEDAGIVFQIVRRDEVTGRFRMWYAGHVRYDLPSGISVRFPTLYAESQDGIHWEKPDLGLFEFESSKSNNIVIPAGNPFGMIIEPNDPDPARRYKAIVWHEPKYVPREGYFLYTSPDGIHWTRETEQPLLVSLQGYTMPQSGIGDTSIFRWDPRLMKYICDVKFVLPGKFRCRGMMESDDLIHWTSPRMTLYPDELDEPDSQVYGHLSFCYESMWIGFLRMMHTERTGWKQTTIELTASRDGRHWTRVGKREEFLPLGNPGEWDADYHDPSWDPILVGDELWIYYRSVNRDPSDKNPNVGHAIGLATLRRDGFVSLNGSDPTGVVITRPLTFAGESLFINAEVAENGWIKASLLDDARNPIRDFGLEDTVTVKTGGISVPVVWKNIDVYRLPKGDHVRLQFEIKNAKIYSFWFQ